MRMIRHDPQDEGYDGALAGRQAVNDGLRDCALPSVLYVDVPDRGAKANTIGHGEEFTTRLRAGAP
jgi:hypothetical protein